MRRPLALLLLTLAIVVAAPTAGEGDGGEEPGDDPVAGTPAGEPAGEEPGFPWWIVVALAALAGVGLPGWKVRRTMKGNAA